MKHNDQIIITGIIDGDEKILTRFYKENRRHIQNFILRNCGNTEDVEDIFQDALVILYQKLASGVIEIEGPIKGYFYGICKNLWRNRLRKKKRLVIEDNPHYFDQQSNDSFVTDLENNEQEYIYKKHFQKLSSDNKNLLLHFFDSKSMKEISILTGYSEGYTRKKKFLAKKKLIEMIEEDPMYEELIAI